MKLIFRLKRSIISKTENKFDEEEELHFKIDKLLKDKDAVLKAALDIPLLDQYLSFVRKYSNIDYSYDDCPDVWKDIVSGKISELLDEIINKYNDHDLVMGEKKIRIYDRTIKNVDWYDANRYGVLNVSYITDDDENYSRYDIEEKEDYFYQVKFVHFPQGNYCSCCRRHTDDGVYQFIYQNGKDMTTRNYMSFCKECMDAIYGVFKGLEEG